MVLSGIYCWRYHRYVFVNVTSRYPVPTYRKKKKFVPCSRLSRNARAHWYFSHLNTCVRVQNRVDLTQFTGDIEVVSVMPVEPVPADWDWDTSSLYQYKVGR